MLRNILSLSSLSILDKIFPVSVIFFAKIFLGTETYDRIGYIMISLNSIISWSNSGLSVSITKAAALSDDRGIRQIISLNLVSTFIAILLFSVFQQENILNESPFFILAILVAGYTTLLKSIHIARYQWKLLLLVQSISTVISLTVFIWGIYYKSFTESIFFIYYAIPLICLFWPQRFYSISSIVRLLRQQILPLFITGASSSLLYLLVLRIISENSDDGLLGDFALILQIVSIIQFLPIILNKISFIDTVRSGLNASMTDIILRLLIISFGIILFVLLGGYFALGDLVLFWPEIFALCVLGVLSIYFGNILVARGREWIWTRISVRERRVRITVPI